MTDTEEEEPYCVDRLDWVDAKTENAFFSSANDCKPVGQISRQYNMATICDNFYTWTGKAVSSKVFWDHLRTMYNLEALEEAEGYPYVSVVRDYMERDDVERLNLKDFITERTNELTPEEKPSTPKIIKDYSRKKEIIRKDASDQSKREKSPEKSKVEDVNESDEDDTPLKPSKESAKEKSEVKPLKSTGKKSNAQTKTETPKRTTRKTKETAEEPSSGKKGDADGLAKPGRKPVAGKTGKRSLRSRDDDSSSPAPTPPPAKRARRI